MLDYHVHTTRSIDCDTPVADSCEAAIAAGITEIAFTDHVDLEMAFSDYPEYDPIDEGFDYYDYEGYQADIDRVQEAYSGRLTILRGVEIGFTTGTRDAVESWLSAHSNYDFVIGSVHHFSFGGLHFPGYFDTRSIDDTMQLYNEQLHAAAETGWFDTLGHIDLPKRYAPATAGEIDPLRHEDQLRDIFKVLIDKQTSFEINTSGLRQGPKSSMPSGQIVSLYASLGGKLITTGSDSHFARHIGSGLETTLEMLRLCGIEELSSFRNRVRTQVSIASLLAA